MTPNVNPNHWAAQPRPRPGARPDSSHRVLGYAVSEPTDPTRSPVRELLHSVNQRLGSPYVQIRSTLYRADLADPLPDFELSVPVEVHVASRDEMEALGRARFPDDRRLAVAKTKEFVERLNAGHTCLVASAKGQPVSYVWVTYNDWWDPALEFTIPVADDQCLGYEAYTIPPFRRLGLRQLLQIEERRLGRDRGKSALLFELHGKDAPLAIKKWEPLGLKQQPIAQHTTYKFFRKLKFTKVKELDGGEEGVESPPGNQPRNPPSVIDIE